MTSPTVDRRQGLVGNTPIKAPVDCASTTPLTLSGEQTIDGVLTSGSRVLVMGQADATTNGIYDSSTAGWTRSQDADGNYDLGRGTLVFVFGGSTFAGRFYTVTTPNPITIGSSALTFQQSLTSSTSVLSFIAAGVGALIRGAQDKMRDFLTDKDYTTLAQAVAASTLTGLALHVIGAWAGLPSIPVASNTTIWMEQGASATTATPNISLFNASGSSNVRIKGTGKIASTVAGANAHVGLIDFSGSTECSADDVELVGFQWAGVLMSGSIRCEARGIYAHDSNGTVQDCAGVQVLDGSTNCRVIDPDIANSGYHGVNVQETGGGLTPVHTIIRGFNISGCNVYGINCYNKTNKTVNQRTSISDGSISDVRGGAPWNTSAGAGIYFADGGGCSVKGVYLEYCCSATSDNSLVPAGIGANVTAPLIAPVIEGNTFYNMGFTPAGVQNPNTVTLAAISANGNTAGLNIGPNVISQALANTAGAFVFVGIYVNGAPNVSMTGLSMVINPLAVGSRGIFIFANGLNISGFSITGCQITGCDLAQINLDQSGGFRASNVSISNAYLSGGSANCENLKISQSSNVNITNVSGSATTAASLDVSGSLLCKFTNSEFGSTGTTTVTTSGACTGSVLDETVSFGADSKMLNAATGFAVKTRGTAAPTTGTWAVGDHRVNTVPASGTPAGWGCSTAGAAGTFVFKAEANFA